MNLNFLDRPLQASYKVRTHRGTKTVRFTNSAYDAEVEHNMRDYFRQQDAAMRKKR